MFEFNKKHCDTIIDIVWLNYWC